MSSLGNVFMLIWMQNATHTWPGLTSPPSKSKRSTSGCSSFFRPVLCFEKGTRLFASVHTAAASTDLANSFDAESATKAAKCLEFPMVAAMSEAHRKLLVLSTPSASSLSERLCMRFIDAHFHIAYHMHRPCWLDRYRQTDKRTDRKIDERTDRHTGAIGLLRETSKRINLRKLF